MKEGSPNKERGCCIGAGSLQSQPGANLHPNTANKRVRVAKGGEADGVALTVTYMDPLYSYSVGIALAIPQSTLLVNRHYEDI